MSLTQVQPGMLGTPQPYSFKNRLINGAMVIDQRNGGASVTNSSSTQPYCLDRYWAYGSVSSKYTVQQNAGSVTPPVGFSNYLGVTSLSSYTVGSSEQFRISQAIEGYNVADLNFGSANAKTVTLSFWVRSSLTGSFGGSLNNGDYSRSYPFLFTISSANTWEQKTITVAGDTTGTWQTTTSAGLWVCFSLGVGSALTNTAGSWATGAYVNATGATSVVGTSGATFYITGIQLEQGVTATTFDYRAYSQELVLAQRYFEKSVAQSVSITANSQTSWSPNVYSTTLPNSSYYSLINFCVTKRTAPTVTIYPYGTATNTGRVSNDVGTDLAANSGFVGISNQNNCSVANSSGGSLTTGSQLLLLGNWYASAEL